MPLNRRRSPTIVVLGMMTRHPVPGVIWQTLHYLLGFQRLGYDVYHVEAHSRPPHMFADSTARAVAFLDRVMSRFGLGGHWVFQALHDDGRCHGLSIERLQRLYREADLVINLHAGTWPLPEHYASDRLICLETDPGRVQVELAEDDPEAIEFLAPHAAFFTFAENYGRPGCGLPTNPHFDFRPTRQPVLLDLWDRSIAGPRPNFRTIANWRQMSGDIQFQGEQYAWSKHHEFLKLIDLPQRTGQHFEMALAKVDDPDRAQLETHGWILRDALAFGQDLDTYRTFIHGARAEFSVAKDQNIRLRTGWFSDRSATFLASGLPVIVQDTAFGCALPTGEGLLPFLTRQQAEEAVGRVCADPARHERAALQIAREFFSHEVVLGRLLEDLGMPRHAEAARSRPGAGGLPTSITLPPSITLSTVGRHPTEIDPETVEIIMRRPSPGAFASPAQNRAPAAASVIVVTHDNLVLTRMCLESVLADPTPALELIVVDNASSDPTRAYLEELERGHPGLRLVLNRDNRSFAEAVNQGLAEAKASRLVILNNDTIVTPGWLTRLSEHLRDPAVGLVGPVTNNAPNEAEIEANYRTYGELLDLAAQRARTHRGQSTEMPVATMFCVAMRRDVFDQIGDLDERYRIGLFEDDDYSERIRAAGLRVVCAEDVFVHHFGQGSFGHLVANGGYAELHEANRRRFESKWGRPWRPHARRDSIQWQRVITEVRQLVEDAVPPEAVVLVANRGDDALLQLGSRTGWPFPSDGAPEPAGHYPADSSAAIEQLERLRSAGATHLVFPRMELWWLEHYPALRDHLGVIHRQVASSDAGVAYALAADGDRARRD